MPGNYNKTGKAAIKTKRIFIAIRIDPGDILTAAIESFKSYFPVNVIRWTDKDNIHVTLAFLGDTAEEAIPYIASLLEDICNDTGRFSITVRSTGLFRDSTDPRILWIGIEKSDRLFILNSRITAGLERTGFLTEKRFFSPHITIGRVKRNSGAGKEIFTDFMNDYHDTVFQTVNVKEITLFESILSATGPIYKPINIFALK